MEDVLKAKELLKDDKTLVFVKGNEIVDSTLSGIKPLIYFLNESKDLRGFSLADKIVGKAQAMLCIKAGIAEVYAKVLSLNGKEILEKYNIPYSYETLTDQIINHKGDDICPMEKVVKDIDDIEEAYKALKEKVLSM